MKYFKYIAFILVGSLFTGCSDFLNPTPSSGITTDSYYKNADELETGLIGVYAGIKGINSTSKEDNHGVQWEFYVTEMRTDNTSTKTPDSEDASDAGQLESFAVLPTNNFVLNYFSSYFQIIYRANIILANMDVVDDEVRAAELEGEARFIRAYAYFNLVRLFGDLPYIDRVVTPDETEVQFTRVPTSVIYEDLIIPDLLSAVAGINHNYTTRANKNAAKALLAKVYLSLESPEYNKAQVLCEEIINSGKYQLQSNFSNVFYSELNSEVIWAIGYNSQLQDNSQLFSAEFMNAVGNSSGVNYVTTDLKAALDEEGGLRTPVAYREDPLTIFGGTIRYQTAKYFPDGDSGGADGQTFEGVPTLAGNDWIVLRYADVLLMHTEAILAGATETSNANAINSFMEVRRRAWPDSATPGKVTRDELLLERRVEFSSENQRFFDLLRFKVANSVLSAFAAANNFNFTANDLLLPIPQNEINLSKASGTEMRQNPGY
ncbi:RagB/SusD family nutrient uptake outer membrane protein [Formosa haliotis]|uniref:RagB/SusD family nutrient uptake outer membrane protein n=1 Tax=Formosa haliotis TaxID=1555194 RepID=UPI0008265027|nr:RagB/SusD family nutrient uptake outer membrane protein [Formosa haliotis]